MASADVDSDLTMESCDQSNVKQHWIWTKHNQIFNLHTLKCLLTSEIPVFRDKYSKVSLASCNASDSKQIWECKTEWLVYLEYEKAYLNYGNSGKNIIVYSGDRIFSHWKRYHTDDQFCSSVSTYNGKTKRWRTKSIINNWFNCAQHKNACTQ